MAKFQFDKTFSIQRHGESRKYQTSLTAEALGLMFLGGVTKYVPELQRGSKTTGSGKVIDVFSRKKIKEILEAMIKDKIHGGMITLNYNKNNETPLEYDEETKVISGDGVLQILDGQHRSRACAMWVEMYQKDPQSVPNPTEFEYPVVLENLSDNEAKTLFSEYATLPLKISKTRGLYLNVDDTVNKIARHLMKESELKDKVEVVTTSVKGTSGNIVTFAVLSETIKNNFQPATQKEADEVADFLVKFFNELVELFPTQLGNVEVHKRNEERKKSFVLETLAWHGYLAIAKELYNKPNWQTKLARLKNTVKVGDWEGEFLSRQNPIFKPILREGEKIINNSATQAFMTKVMSSYVAKDEPIENLVSQAG